MDFDLTDEQRMLKETVKKFSEKELAPVVKKYHDANQAIPKEEVQRLLKLSLPLGIMGNVIPDEPGSLAVR